MTTDYFGIGLSARVSFWHNSDLPRRLPFGRF